MGGKSVTTQAAIRQGVAPSVDLAAGGQARRRATREKILFASAFRGRLRHSLRPRKLGRGLRNVTRRKRPEKAPAAARSRRSGSASCIAVAVFFLELRQDRID